MLFFSDDGENTKWFHSQLQAGPGRVRPKARHLQTRLLALSEPPQKQEEEEEEVDQTLQPTYLVSWCLCMYMIIMSVVITLSQVPSPPPSPATPPHSSPLPPRPLPFNMKPAQLRWQKEVTYDSSGNIVDMTRLDPFDFPSHRYSYWLTGSGWLCQISGIRKYFMLYITNLCSDCPFILSQSASESESHQTSGLATHPHQAPSPTPHLHSLTKDTTVTERKPQAICNNEPWEVHWDWR